MPPDFTVLNVAYASFVMIAGLLLALAAVLAIFQTLHFLYRLVLRATYFTKTDPWVIERGGWKRVVVTYAWRDIW